MMSKPKASKTRFPDISEEMIRALIMGSKHPRSIDEDVRRCIAERNKK